jgi:hypothetical protein
MKNLCLILFSIFPFFAIGQKNTVTDTIRLQFEISTVSADREENLYLADRKGNVYKLDSTGKQVFIYSPQFSSELSVLEAWRRMNIFCFYREQQKYSFLNRFLALSSENIIPEQLNGFITVATLSQDNKIWMFDNRNFRLLKFDPERNETVISTQIDLRQELGNLEIVFIREYEGLLYLADINKGVLLFDFLGNYKRLLPAAGVKYLSVQGTHIYWITSEGIADYDLQENRVSNQESPITDLSFFIKGKNRNYYFKNSLVLIEKPN